MYCLTSAYSRLVVGAWIGGTSGESVYAVAPVPDIFGDSPVRLDLSV